MPSSQSSNLNASDIEKQEVAEDYDSDSTVDPEAPIDSPTKPAPGYSGSQLGADTSQPVQGKSGQSIIVDFDGEDDPLRPMNWPRLKKRVAMVICALMTATTTMASSIFASAIPAVAEEFNVSTDVSTLGMTMFLLGFGTGPLLWAPLSEVYGRRIASMPAFVVGICFTFGTATAKDIQTVLITRFFTGFFSASPVAVTGGVLADLFSPRERGPAMALYQLAVAGGPLTAPIIGGAIANSGVSWRWIEYLTGIVTVVVCFASLFFVEESYAPVILLRKARRLRHTSGNWALHAKHEEWDATFSELANKYLVRPFQLLGTPICFCMSTYNAFIFGLVYLQFTAFPIVYQEQRGWNPLIGSLAFIAVLVGTIIALGLAFFCTKFYAKAFIANNNKPVPEARLYIAMIGSVCLTSGLFVFGWTANPDIFWFPSFIGAALIGIGFVATFQGTLMYLLDTFQKYAASAIAANTVYRCLLAAVFPLFATHMFHNLGTEWACTLLGCIAAAMMPIPWLFYLYGRRIRARGKWSRQSVQ